VIFVPFALQDRQAYVAKTRERLRALGVALTSVHDVSNMRRAIADAEVIFVGGGNTFRLLKGLYDHDLLDPIRQAVAAGTPFIGSSAGAIVAGPSLKTTKDMPVVQPPSFESLGWFLSRSVRTIWTRIGHPLTWEKRRRNASCSSSKKMTRQSWFARGIDSSRARRAVVLRGPHAARIFRRGEEAIEAPSGTNLQTLLESTAAPAGALA